MSHFVEKCRVCTRVLTQCRCPDPHKEVRWSICAECARVRVVGQVVPSKHFAAVNEPVADIAAVVVERDRYMARCRELEARLQAIRELVDGGGNKATRG